MGLELSSKYEEVVLDEFNRENVLTGYNGKLVIVKDGHRPHPDFGVLKINESDVDYYGLDTPLVLLKLFYHDLERLLVPVDDETSVTG
ncbi:MAG: hypothetical protein KKF68_02770 [Nanoarchaeota archaeon]|nr:hypothetical protein [Nanoarchaeota archaeon]